MREVKDTMKRVRTRHNSQSFVNRSPLCALYALAAAILLCAAPALARAQANDRDETVLVAFGDSLTAGLGVQPEHSFPVRLEAALEDKGHDVRVVNAGVSGDTTAAALARLDWAIPDEADAVIVELGANDALRGLDPAEARKNLDAILTRLKEKGLPVLLAGMPAPRNMGSEYAEAFDPIYADLAGKHDVGLYPFFLEGVAGEPRLNQSDGLHPNAEGVETIVANILPAVEALLERAEARR